MCIVYSLYLAGLEWSNHLRKSTFYMLNFTIPVEFHPGIPSDWTKKTLMFCFVNRGSELSTKQT